MSENKDNEVRIENPFNRIYKKSSFVFLVKLGGLAAGFIFTYIVTRYYGAACFGLFSICLNLVQAVVLLTVMGFDNALMKLVAGLGSGNSKGTYAKIYLKMTWLLLPASIILSGILFFYADNLAKNLFHKQELTTWFRISSLMILPLTFLMVHASGLRGLKRTGWFSSSGKLPVS